MNFEEIVPIDVFLFGCFFPLNCNFFIVTLTELLIGFTENTQFRTLGQKCNLLCAFLRQNSSSKRFQQLNFGSFNSIIHVNPLDHYINTLFISTSSI